MNLRNTWRLADLILSGILIVLLSVSMCTRPASADSLDWSKQDKDKIVVISGVVDQQVIGQAGFISQLAGEPVIRLVINTPGGSVIAGNMFIQAMEFAKAKGSKIECVVTNLAASMGIHILAHCSSRYVMTGGLLLFHEICAGLRGVYTERDLRRMAESMKASSQYLDGYLRAALGCSAEVYREHNEGETMWAVEYFQKTFPKFKLKIIDAVILPDQFDIPIFDPLGGKGSEDRKRLDHSPLLLEAS